MTFSFRIVNGFSYIISVKSNCIFIFHDDCIQAGLYLWALSCNGSNLQCKPEGGSFPGTVFQAFSLFAGGKGVCCLSHLQDARGSESCSSAEI